MTGVFAIIFIIINHLAIENVWLFSKVRKVYGKVAILIMISTYETVLI